MITNRPEYTLHVRSTLYFGRSSPILKPLQEALTPIIDILSEQGAYRLITDERLRLALLYNTVIPSWNPPTSWEPSSGGRKVEITCRFVSDNLIGTRWFDLSDACTPQQSRAVEYLHIPLTAFFTFYYCHPLILRKRTYQYVSQRFERGWYWFYSSYTGRLSRELGANRCCVNASHHVAMTVYA